MLECLENRGTLLVGTSEEIASSGKFVGTSIALVERSQGGFVRPERLPPRAQKNAQPVENEEMPYVARSRDALCGAMRYTLLLVCFVCIFNAIYLPTIVRGGVETKLSVAVCLTGHLRTFNRVKENMKTYVLDPLAADVRVFMVVAHGNSYRSKYFVPEEEYVNPQFSVVRAASVDYYDEAPISGGCFVNITRSQGTLARWYHTWKKLDICHRRIEQYEHKHKHRFDFVIRLRPDVFFFAGVPAARFFPTNTMIVPYGMVTCQKPCLNDHMVVAPRALSPVYYNLVRNYDECKPIMKHLEADGNRLLHFALANANVTVRRFEFSYTLARANGLECERMKFSGIRREALYEMCGAFNRHTGQDAYQPHSVM